LVVKGKYTILDMGDISGEVIVAIGALILVTAALHYHVKGAFCVGLFFGTFVWWAIAHEWPEKIVDQPEAEKTAGHHEAGTILLIFNLFFLYFLTLNGLARSLSDLAGLTKKNGTVPRGGFLLIVCGLTTMLSGYFTGPPILVSPESAAGIKAGAKTGLSTLVCGIIFGIATFFYPLFAAVPAAGTAPLLIMVGVVLFANVKRVDWTNYKESVPAYAVLFFIPFTYSILRGVAFGYVLYIFIMLFTGDFISNATAFLESINPLKPKQPTIEDHGMEEDEHGEGDRSRSLSSPTKIFNKMMSAMDMDASDIKIDHL
jgi:adenine/guanine/hypoxanthine permease